MQHSVIENRELYLGGSDIPALLGISPFKTRYQLLKEKAQIIPIAPVFVNKAIQYGITLEPVIRDYLNTDREPENQFKEWKFETPLDSSTLRARGHLDGYDARTRTCLEIKTTSETRGDSIRDYPEYLYQMLFYMDMPRPRLKSGILAVYIRPDDYNEYFDETRLHIFKFELSDMKSEIKHLRAEVARFLADVETIRANPEKCEADLINQELSETSAKAIAFEKKLAELKEAEAEYKALKAELIKQMTAYGVPSFDAGGYQITLTAEKPETVETVEEIDVEALKLFFPDVAAEVIHKVEKTKAGRSASVRVTKRKGAGE